MGDCFLQVITDPQEKDEALEALVEHIIPGTESHITIRIVIIDKARKADVWSTKPT